MRVFILFLGLLFFQVSFANDIKVIDPNLIKISKTKEINKRKFNSKISKDSAIYKKNSANLNKEQANLYQILDKILRANKLYNQNYRIGIEIETKEINAFLNSTNLILINSSLYDTFLENEDALAFVISHELSHLLLNHSQACAQNNLKIQQIKKQIQELDLLDKNYEKNLLKLKRKLNEIYKKEKNLELSADIEALTLIIKANYNTKGAIEVIKFLSKLENVYTKKSLHPNCKNRLETIENELDLIDLSELKIQGQNNLLNSFPLKVEKSIDNKTIILIKPKNVDFEDYIAKENYEKLNKKAYFYFLNSDFKNAKVYFEKAYKEKRNYISALYLKNIYEFEFNKTNDKKLLKIISLWQKRANRLKP